MPVGREDGDLRVAIAVIFAELGGAVPDFGCFVFQITELFAVGNFAHGAAMLLDHFEHRRDVVLCDRLRHAAGARVVIARERSHGCGHARALLIRFAGHDRGDRAAEGAAFLAVVAVAIAHDERAEIGVAEAERAEDVASFPRSP